MASDSGFDRGQENSLPATPLSSIMNRFQRFRDGLTSPRANDTPPVTSPTSIRSFSETPARTSSNEPPPLNGSVAPTLSDEHQIVPRSVTPITLLDTSSVTQELLSDEFLLQQQATQQVTRELDEAQDIEIKRSRLIQEDREARDREQRQCRQAEMDQYQLYLRFVASQETSARSVSDTSTDTWQDVIRPTSSMEGDRRNVSAMNVPANTSPPVPPHTNRALCRQPPHIIGHKIEHCPIIMQHGLRFPTDSLYQLPNGSVNPTTEPPPPSSPTIGNNSISGSIHRQVATMERTMTTQMDELADNVSQVMDPIETSFDASIPSSPMPTGWKTGLSRSYRNKLHSLPFDQHDNL